MFLHLCLWMGFSTFHKIVGRKGIFLLELYPICLLAVWRVSVSYRHLPVGIFGMVCMVFFCTVRLGGSSIL
jgi:hypothetical protein